MIESYIEHLLEDEELEDKERLMEIAEAVRKKYGKETKCTYFYAGGFDSPGYEIDCYVITYLEDDVIQGYPVQIECY